MAKKKSKGAVKIARQKRLPGMENSKIAAIENAALNYVEGRDARMAATEEEVALKQTLIETMHKCGKAVYRRGNISVKLVVEKEGVKVKVLSEDDAKKEAAKEAKEKVAAAPEPSSIAEEVEQSGAFEEIEEAPVGEA